MNAVDLRFSAPTHPLSINTTGGWQKRRRLLDPWKDAAQVTSRNHLVRNRGFTPVPVTVQVVIPFRGTRRRDPHNYTGTVVKAIVDGIVRGGLVPDDNAEWVTVLDSQVSIQRDASQPLQVHVRIRPRETPNE